MGEEERESLADFRRHACLQLRHDLAVQFAAFEAEHAGGIQARDRDVDDYHRENRIDPTPCTGSGLIAPTITNSTFRESTTTARTPQSLVPSGAFGAGHQMRRFR